MNADGVPVITDETRKYLKQLVELVRSVVEPYEEGQAQIRKYKAQQRAEKARIARTLTTSDEAS